MPGNEDEGRIFEDENSTEESKLRIGFQGQKTVNCAIEIEDSLSQ